MPANEPFVTFASAASRTGNPPETWWWPPGSTSGGDVRPVLFFPPSGAEPSSAQVLVAHAAGVRFGVLQLPGRGTRIAEPAPTELAALIDQIAHSVAALDGPPPMLVGHSFGGLVGYGVTAALERMGRGPARLMVVAANSPTAWTAELAADPARSDPAAFVTRRTERIVTGGGVPADLLAHPEFAARARALTRVDVELSRAGFAAETIRTPVTVVAGRDDTVLAPGAGDGWAEIAGGGLRRHDVPGGHFFYRAAPQRLMALIRMDLQALDLDDAT